MLVVQNVETAFLAGIELKRRKKARFEARPTPIGVMQDGSHEKSDFNSEIIPNPGSFRKVTSTNPLDEQALKPRPPIESRRGCSLLEPTRPA